MPALDELTEEMEELAADTDVLKLAEETDELTETAELAKDADEVKALEEETDELVESDELADTNDDKLDALEGELLEALATDDTLDIDTELTEDLLDTIALNAEELDIAALDATDAESDDALEPTIALIVALDDRELKKEFDDELDDAGKMDDIADEADTAATDKLLAPDDTELSATDELLDDVLAAEEAPPPHPAKPSTIHTSSNALFMIKNFTVELPLFMRKKQHHSQLRAEWVGRIDEV